MRLLLVRQAGKMEEIPAVRSVISRFFNIAFVAHYRRPHQGIEHIDVQPGIVLAQLGKFFDALHEVFLRHLMLAGGNQSPIEHGVRGNDGRIGGRCVILQPLPELIRMPHIGGIAQELLGWQQHFITCLPQYIHRLMVRNRPVIMGNE